MKREREREIEQEQEVRITTPGRGTDRVRGTSSVVRRPMNPGPRFRRDRARCSTWALHGPPSCDTVTTPPNSVSVSVSVYFAHRAGAPRQEFLRGGSRGD